MNFIKICVLFTFANFSIKLVFFFYILNLIPPIFRSFLIHKVFHKSHEIFSNSWTFFPYYWTCPWNSWISLNPWSPRNFPICEHFKFHRVFSNAEKLLINVCTFSEHVTREHFKNSRTLFKLVKKFQILVYFKFHFINSQIVLNSRAFAHSWIFWKKLFKKHSGSFF